GMMSADGAVAVCGVHLGVGSYGFGLDAPAPGSSEGARFLLYNQAGEKVGDCAAEKDAQIKLPRPLQVVLGKGEPARLYLGRYRIDLAARRPTPCQCRTHESVTLGRQPWRDALKLCGKNP